MRALSLLKTKRSSNSGSNERPRKKQKVHHHRSVERNAAARRIATAFRSYRTRRTAARNNAAARRIATAFRSYRTRRNAEEMSRTAATMQGAFEREREMLMIRRKAKEKARLRAAKKILSSFRSYKTRRNEDEMSRSAATMQEAFKREKEMLLARRAAEERARKNAEERARRNVEEKERALRNARARERALRNAQEKARRNAEAEEKALRNAEPALRQKLEHEVNMAISRMRSENPNKVYKLSIMKFHPDKLGKKLSGNTGVYFRKLNNAYRALKNQR